MSTSKRDFVDFIDLTAEGYYEDDEILPSIENDEPFGPPGLGPGPPPAKIGRIDYGQQQEHQPHSNPLPPLTLPPLYTLQPQLQYSSLNLQDNTTINHPTPNQQLSSFVPNGSQSQPNYSNYHWHLNKFGVVEPPFLPPDYPLANPIRGSGLQKLEYNPNTIAHDVLIALDRHPDRGALNLHLRPLAAGFQTVDNNSDLGTLDPRFLRHQAPSDFQDTFGNMPPPPQTEGPPVRQPTRPTRGGSYSMNDRNGHQKASFEQAQDWQINTPSNPNSHRPMNIRHYRPSSLHNESNAGLNIAAISNQPTRQASYSLPSRQPQPQGGYASPYASNSAGPVQASAQAIASPGQALAASTSSPRRGRPPKTSDYSTLASTPKRRGRPPIDYAAILASNEPRNLVVKDSAQTSSKPGTDTDRGSNNPSTSADQSSMSVVHPTIRRSIKFTSLIVEPSDFEITIPAKVIDPVPKKRGRPFKNPQSVGEPVVRIPKKRGRPFSKPASGKNIQLPEPTYVVYACKWQGCSAELQNLATLKLHILKTHYKREEGGFLRCLWDRCTKVHTTENGEELPPQPGSASHHEFYFVDPWINHITEEHFSAYAWHLGDGPRSSIERSVRSQSLASATYLNDREGRQVTPSVEDQLLVDSNPKKDSLKRFERKVIGTSIVYDPIDDPNDQNDTDMKDSDEEKVRTDSEVDGEDGEEDADVTMDGS